MLAEGRKQGQVGPKRKKFCARATWDPTDLEKASFESVKSYLSDPRFLTHHDPEKVTYAKINASNARGFGIMLFHLKEDYKVPKDLSKIAAIAVQPILFLSKLLSPAEKNYHPTELEVACLVYTCRRLRVMFHSSKRPIIVLTDHSATRGVCSQVTLVTSDANRANMRLYHASQYLSQFNLDIHHIPGKTNIVPDALSRLSAFEPKDVSQDNTLDDIYVMSEACITEEFKGRLTSGYAKDPHFQRILRLLKCGDKLPDSCTRPGVPFFIESGLLYNTTNKGRDRLCIPDIVL
jgi:hypothetical protein